MHGQMQLALSSNASAFEPLKAAPTYMRFAPALTLRYYRLRDNLISRLSGAPLPPHA